MFVRSWSEKLKSASARASVKHRRGSDAARRSGRRRASLGCESLEGRLLLTTTALPPFVPPANDPLFAQQWNLNNTGQVGGIPGADVNVLPAWQQGYTGKGVTVSVVDSGVYYPHPDLSANYNAGLSYNYFDNLPDGKPPLGPLLLPIAPDAQFGEDSHGTMVAGIIAGNGANGTGTLGVAPGATIASERLVTFDPSGNLVQGGDTQEFAALTAHNQQIDVYSNSWGAIPQQFASVPGAQQPGGLFGNTSLTTQDGISAMQQGAAGITPTGAKVLAGRGGLGNIYVFAAGNSNFSSELAQLFGPQYAQYAIGNTNNQAETASRYAIVVAAVGPAGQQALYSDPGASILVSAPGGYDGAGADDENGIPTSSVIAVPDDTQPSGYSYQPTYTDNGTFGMNGTSAATPHVSGVVALMLQANPNLSWRDVQQILAESASQNDPTDPGWSLNGYGYTSDGAIVPVDSSGNYAGGTPLPTGVTVAPFHINNKYGFGEVNANNAVNLAKNWTPLQPETNVSSGVVTVNQTIPNGVAGGISFPVTFTGGLHVEHVELDLNITHPARGDIQVTLTSPNGVTSVLQAARNFTANGLDYTLDGVLNAAGTATTPNANYTNWATSSVRDWGESSAGTWIVTVSDMDVNVNSQNGSGNPQVGTLNDFTLKLFGNQDYAPIAQDFSVNAPQGQTTPIDVLSHTYDTDGTFTIAPGSLQVLAQPTGGTISVNPQTGIVQYTPVPGFFGTDHFTYTVTDTNGVASRVATATINVGRVFTAPVANNIQATTAIGTPISVNILANVTDSGGTVAPANIQIVNQPSFGTVSVNPNTGVATYTPGPNFILSDSFTYQVTDSNHLTSNVATVTIDLALAAPVASSFSQPAADENVTQQVNVLGHVTGSSSPSGVKIVTPPLHGTTLIDPVTGVVNYTPAANFFGSDSFSYAVANTQGTLSNTAVVSLTVLQQGVPLALSHEFVLAPDGTVMTGIRALDDPTNSGGLTAQLVGQAHFGTVALYPDGSFTYVRGPGFPGIDSFTYVQNNGQNNSSVGTIRLVTPDVHYVENLYRVLLNRTAPDASLIAWAAAMGAGVTRAQVANAFLGSPEYLSNFIQAGYQKFLGRPVDPAGLNYWLTQMQTGLSMEQFYVVLAGSPEYFAHHGGTVTGLITGYYNDFLGRNPSPNDLAYWTNQFNAGMPTYQLALIFVTSPEYDVKFVMSLYQDYFGSPITGGAAANFIQSLQPNVSRASLQTAVLASQQFYLLG